MDDLISRQAAIDALKIAYWDKDIQSAKDDPCIVDAMTDWAIRQIKALPSAQPEVAQQLYQYKCYITDNEGLQHEVIHVGDIRRVTGWMI